MARPFLALSSASLKPNLWDEGLEGGTAWLHNRPKYPSAPTRTDEARKSWMALAPEISYISSVAPCMVCNSAHLVVSKGSLYYQEQGDLAINLFFVHLEAFNAQVPASVVVWSIRRHSRNRRLPMMAILEFESRLGVLMLLEIFIGEADEVRGAHATRCGAKSNDPLNPPTDGSAGHGLSLYQSLSPAKAVGRVLFEQVCKQLHLLEADYFGLEYQDSNNIKYWLDLEKPLSRQVGLTLVDTLLRFCVKFYTPDPAQLEEEFTRYLYCLQIKRDLAQGLLQCNDNTSALMASYIVQAECGDHVVEDYPDHTYLSSYKFVPNQDHELERRIMENHKKHAGQSPAEADLNLLETSRRCELYGMKMHAAKGEMFCKQETSHRKKEVPLKCKEVPYRVYFLPIVVYAAETCTLNVRETRKGEAMGMKFTDIPMYHLKELTLGEYADKQVGFILFGLLVTRRSGLSLDQDHEGVPLNLAVAHMGIVVFQNYTKINTFSWAKIRKISFKRKRFLIKLHPEGYGYYKDTVEFFFEGRNECKNFWKKCVENHGFFRCSAVKHVPRQKTRVLSRGSSFRYSGRTQKQIVEFVRENYVTRQTFQSIELCCLKVNTLNIRFSGRTVQGVTRVLDWPHDDEIKVRILVRSQSFRHSSSVHSSVANVGTSLSAHPLLPLGENAVGRPDAHRTEQDTTEQICFCFVEQICVMLVLTTEHDGTKHDKTFYSYYMHSPRWRSVMKK
uniref:FERM domain-containing protein n=1 Tax=Timema douglasi TaxID=61478 RepID=A0A7R8Z8U1_TIMDO|nr:unnamed protein product [Timema douglasi]